MMTKTTGIGWKEDFIVVFSAQMIGPAIGVNKSLLLLHITSLNHCAKLISMIGIQSRMLKFGGLLHSGNGHHNLNRA